MHYSFRRLSLINGRPLTFSITTPLCNACNNSLYLITSSYSSLAAEPEGSRKTRSSIYLPSWQPVYPRSISIFLPSVSTSKELLSNRFPHKIVYVLSFPSHPSCFHYPINTRSVSLCDILIIDLFYRRTPEHFLFKQLSFTFLNLKVGLRDNVSHLWNI